MQHLERKHLKGEKALYPVSNHNYLKLVNHCSNFHVPTAVPLIKFEQNFFVLQRVLRLTKSMYVSPFLGHSVLLNSCSSTHVSLEGCCIHVAQEG